LTVPPHLSRKSSAGTEWKETFYAMKKIRTRAGAMTLAVSLCAGVCLPARAAVLSGTCDETFYATLDYYGALSDASVVKSYQTNGHSSITDYGVYDAVTNLTDDRQPTVSGGAVTFNLEGDVPDKFYFEGKTGQPFRDLPWTISVSYKLNGAPALAEDLAGRTGLVEIALDVLPNPLANDFSRHNLVLTAAAAFNDDDITSLEAPGAQVQTIGNLHTVLFAVLPGEEQHFAIRVGSEAFTFSGLILLAVPATLQQVEQVAELKEDKDKAQDSLDAIDASLDVILNTLEGMSGSLNATAAGLDRLNAARAQVSQGKGPVYDSADTALGDVDLLADDLEALDPYLDLASDAIADSVSAVNGLHEAVLTLSPELAAARETITALQRDTADLRDLLGDVEGYNKRAGEIAESLEHQTEDLEEETQELELRLRLLESALNQAKGINSVGTGDMLGSLPSDQSAQMRQVLALHSQYTDYLSANGLSQSELSFEDFLISASYQRFLQATGQTPDAFPLTAFVSSDPQGLVSQARQAAQAYQSFSDMGPAMGTVNGKIKELNKLITDLTKPTADVAGAAADLLETLGDSGLSGDLSNLAGLCRSLLKTMKEHEGEGAATLTDLDRAGGILSRITETGDATLSRLDSLNLTVNTYEPILQASLNDVDVLSGAARTTMRDLRVSLSTAEELLRTAGPNLDAGTRASLAGLSEALRRSTSGLDQTGAIREAKDTVRDLVDDEWDAHSGEVDTLLLMDAHAQPVSMTSSRNPAPGNVQYVMRTQEIKEADPEPETDSAQKQADTRTVWQRIVDMFVGIWQDIVNFFTGNKN